MFTEDDDKAPWIDGSSSTLINNTPSKKFVLPVVLLEYAGRYCLTSLQLMLIEFPGFNVRSIKLLFFSSIFCVLSWKSEDKTAFQVKETGKICLLNIFMSESYLPGLRGPSSPTIVPHKNLALYSRELDPVEVSMDEFEDDDKVMLGAPLADKDVVAEEA